MSNKIENSCRSQIGVGGGGQRQWRISMGAKNKRGGARGEGGGGESNAVGDRWKEEELKDVWRLAVSVVR
jgi:hypothetical protein